jgi:D-cysteine desulfhydrase
MHPALASTPDALGRAFPRLGFPRLALGEFPTAVERLPWAPNGAELWVKREDRSAALYGGNKVRKLEYLLAVHAGRPLLTIGGTGSHHILATALYGQRVGSPVYGVMAPQPDNPHVAANQTLMERTLADWIEVPSRLLIPAGMLRLRARLQRRGLPQPVDIPAGGSNPIGSLGWVAGALELAEQVRAGVLPEPAQIWLPLGSGGNAAGLLVGLRLAGLSTLVMGVRVVEIPLSTASATRLLARRIVGLLRERGLALPPGFHLGGFHAVSGYLGDGYGHTTPTAAHTIHLAEERLGLALEGTYTAKALAACLDALRARPTRALFLDTVSSQPLPSPPVT